jgi:hypothetical protein
MRWEVEKQGYFYPADADHSEICRFATHFTPPINFSNRAIARFKCRIGGENATRVVTC